MKTYIQPTTTLMGISTMIMQVASPGYEPTVYIGGPDSPTGAL